MIPSVTIDRVAGHLLQHGRVPRAYLGAGLRDVPLTDSTTGAMAMTLDATGPAAAAGMRQGDIIVTWQGRKLHDLGALLRTLRTHAVGSQVVVGVTRGGTPVELTVTIGDRPPE